MLRYILAFADALVCAASSGLCVVAARRGSLRWLIPSAFLGLLAVPLFYALIRVSDGEYASATTIGALATAAFSVGIACISGDRQTFGEWVGFGVIIAGVVIRAMCARP